ncbi:MAG: hypothetical protein QXP66_01770 [Candidatus Aenigmatarchaeota archaeon]
MVLQFIASPVTLVPIGTLILIKMIDRASYAENALQEFDNQVRAQIPKERAKDIADALDQHYVQKDSSASKQELAKDNTRDVFKKRTIQIQPPIPYQVFDTRPVEPYELDELYSREKATTISIIEKSTNRLLIKNNNFFIQSIRSTHLEDFTLIKGNEGFSVFPFGEQPQQFVIAGIFVEGDNLNQYSQFFIHYLEMIRLSKSFGKYKVTLVQLPSFFLEGYFVSFDYSTSADFEGAIAFSCGFLVTKRAIFADVIGKRGTTKPVIIFYELSERRAIVDLEETLREQGIKFMPKTES